ncbi:MAG: hypothetical protein ABIW82_01195 [Dokdonella sp.]
MTLICKNDPLLSMRLRACVLGCALYIAGSYAQAHNFLCVSTAAGLQNALTQSSDGGTHSGEVNTIYLGEGTFKTGTATGNGPFHYSSTASTGSISIQGGAYGTDCSSYSHSPAHAILDGNNATQVLRMLSMHGEVSVQLVTIQNGESSTDGGGLAVNNIQAGYDAVVFIGLNRIRNNHTTTVGGGVALYADKADQLLLSTNLITGNSADNGYGAAILFANGSTTVNQQTLVTHNVVYGNMTSQPGAVGGIGCGSTGAQLTYVSDNVFWNNGGIGLYLIGNNVYLKSNDYGTLGGSLPANNADGMSVSPRFVDAAGGNFHLAGDSPLLGVKFDFLGLNNDLAGDPFPMSGKGDLGAYAETIFSDGFNGN